MRAWRGWGWGTRWSDWEAAGADADKNVPGVVNTLEDVLDSDGSSSTVTAITITISTLVDHNDRIILRQISKFPSHSLDLTAEST